jgi:hypothetical protein
MQDTFPAVGHKYLVDFRSANGAGFRVQLDFESNKSLTYTGVDAKGNPIPNSSETVDITVEPIRDHLFLVTWQENDGTTVVHLEDYKKNTIITNITEPSTDPKVPPTFSNFYGSMTQIA